jgi:hypothetical protein
LTYKDFDIKRFSHGKILNGEILIWGDFDNGRFCVGDI